VPARWGACKLAAVESFRPRHGKARFDDPALYLS
jgi:hypothetical protein